MAKLRKLNGYIPSTPDKRNYNLEMYNISSSGDKPAKHTITDLPPIFDQGQTGTCVANGLSSRVARNQFKETGQWVEYSRAFIYAQKAFKDSEGMVPRVALSRTMKLGTVPSSRFEMLSDVDTILKAYDNWKSGFESWESMLELSRYNRFESFAELNTMDEIKTALLQDKMVGIGISVMSNFDRPKNGFVEYDSSQAKRGGHWIEIVGYDDERGGWLIQNSWGENWGINGRAFLSYDYPYREAWVVFDYKPESKKKILELTLGDKTGKYNGVDFDLRVEPFFKQYSDLYSALCTELRPIFEKMGYSVYWDTEKETVTIYK